jgi:haloacetate dehalogenase
VRTLTVLDISPTLKMYRNTTMQFAKAYYHWFFLIQEAPIPERMLKGQAPFYVLNARPRKKRPQVLLQRGHGPVRARVQGPAHHPRDLRGLPRRSHHRPDARPEGPARKIRMPLLALWGRQGVIEALFDCLEDWREVATDVRGRASPAATSFPRRSREELVAELRRFLASNESPLVSGPYASLQQ